MATFVHTASNNTLINVDQIVSVGVYGLGEDPEEPDVWICQASMANGMIHDLTGVYDKHKYDDAANDLNEMMSGWQEKVKLTTRVDW